MNFFKKIFFSITDSFKIFRGKELFELLYLAFINVKEIFNNLGMILIYSFALSALLFTKTNSITFLLICWFLNFNCLMLLRPAVDIKNYKYFLSYLLVSFKLLALFLLIFYLPYCILHPDFLPSDSLAMAFLLTFFGLFGPYHFSGIKIVNAILLSLIFISFFIGFKSLIYHLLLMAYLNFEEYLNWGLYIFMFDKKLFHILGIAGFFISPFIVFVILSILDSRKNIKYQIQGLARGIKIFLLNYPISFVWFTIFKIGIIYIYRLFSVNYFLIKLILTILFIFFYFFYLSFLTNMYVKKVHEQCDY